MTNRRAPSAPFQIAAALLVLLCAQLVPSAAHANPEAAVGACNPTVRIELVRFFNHAQALTVTGESGFHISWAKSDDRTLAGNDIAPTQTFTIQVAAASQPGKTSAQLVAHTGSVYRLQPGQSITLAPPQSEPRADDNGPATTALTLQRPAQAAHHYRGALEITALADESLRVVNVLSLEDYLKGVIGPELGKTAPLEALKAQAIAARTYTIKNLGKCAAEQADLDDTSHCQNYEGADAENWRCRTAVSQTAGEILTYQGTPIDAVYATDCGGMTGEGDAPYLKPVEDRDCAESAPWTLSVPLPNLQIALTKAGVTGLGSDPSAVKISSRDESGRVLTLSVTTKDSAAPINVPGALLRKALGYDRLRSTLFDVAVDAAGRDCVFTGRGWGHGLGLCQHGAIAMAKTGTVSFNQILMHFYSGVAITALSTDILHMPARMPLSTAASQTATSRQQAKPLTWARSITPRVQPAGWGLSATTSSLSLRRGL